jgi:hypothetical protein
VALPIWSYSAVAAASGNFCTIVVPFPQVAIQNPAQNSSPVIDLASYYISGGSATGTINFQELAPDGVTWLTLTAPAQITLGAAAFNGVINGPFLGLRIVVGSLAVSTVTLFLKGSVRSQ